MLDDKRQEQGAAMGTWITAITDACDMVDTVIALSVLVTALVKGRSSRVADEDKDDQ
jgi:hypothetical protein